MEVDDSKQEENPDGAVLFDSDSLHENLCQANIHYDGNRPPVRSTLRARALLH